MTCPLPFAQQSSRQGHFSPSRSKNRTWKSPFIQPATRLAWARIIQLLSIALHTSIPNSLGCVVLIIAAWWYGWCYQRIPLCPHPTPMPFVYNCTDIVLTHREHSYQVWCVKNEKDRRFFSILYKRWRLALHIRFAEMVYKLLHGAVIKNYGIDRWRKGIVEVSSGCKRGERKWTVRRSVERIPWC